MLDQVYRRIEAATARGVLPIVIFDLDSTLFDTAGRNLRILREYGEACGDPELGRICAEVRLEELGWSVLTPLERRGITRADQLDDVEAFWRERFFSDGYLLHDEPAPGAVSFVNGCHDRGALVYYLTGRHVGGMEVGTVRALTRHGFPFWRGRCALHLKPARGLSDRRHKEQALDLVRSYQGEVVATFENDPGNAHLFLRGFPGALHFLYGDVRAPDAEAPHPDLVPLHDFYLG